MIWRLRFSHCLLWHSDDWYRRAWLFAPQILAITIAGSLLISNGPGAPEKTGPTAGWGKPVPGGQLGSEADALRDRAKTDPEAFETLKAQAALGNSMMQFSLGTLYDADFKLSKLVQPNMQEALRYYRAAAEQGHIPAAHLLGNALLHGSHVPKDPAAGIPWLLKAANANFAPSQALMGDVYWTGIAPYPKNPTEAVQWYLKAAGGSGQAGAERMLGYAFLEGTGAEKNETTAMQWFQKAANQGDHYAQSILGDAFWTGRWTYPRNVNEAFLWYMKAADDPALPGVARMVGIAYRDGTGAPRDNAQARHWLELAAQRGDKPAADILRTLPP
jgi:TPR repeat protein